MSSPTIVPVPVVSVVPIVLAAPGRGIDLAMRVSAPMTGEALPVIIQIGRAHV